MQRIENEGQPYEETILYVVEVFYNEDDSTIIGWTEKESVWGEDIDEVRQTLHWMLDALDKPLLIEGDLLQRMEEIEAMGGDAHDIGIFETGEISLGEELLDDYLLNFWEDDGGPVYDPPWDQD